MGSAYSGSHISEGFLEEEATSRVTHGGFMLGEETSAAARSLRKAEWLVLCHVGQIEDSIVGVTGKKAVS